MIMNDDRFFVLLMITGECGYLDNFFAVIYPAIECCYNPLGSILGLLRHALNNQFMLFPHLFHNKIWCLA